MKNWDNKIGIQRSGKLLLIYLMLILFLYACASAPQEAVTLPAQTAPTQIVELQVQLDPTQEPAPQQPAEQQPSPTSSLAETLPTPLAVRPAKKNISQAQMPAAEPESGQAASALQAAAPLSTLPPTEPKVGFTAPDFTLQTVSGETIHLSDMRGQAVVLNYWASWCIPCQEELPALELIRSEYADQGIQIISVNAIEQDSIEKVKATIQKYNLTYNVLLDQENQVYNLYRVGFFPTSFFIDANGVVRDIILGGATHDKFRARVDRLLSGN